ncbi:hypothetical protein [[Mycobacterium] wendilense]|uniref:ANTAR domain-containing protein n=1 Tax=[Mycobacterium] wendilense TaxID=3064284 RepID=A0ABM9M8I1_9MYCO|nr:hypothetical protein [Mycolicibacterium sp. MU0050]CAJ1578981.1 hypothetical protein MU0050_000277 [Mycolicibacterium sp. MU0050]
MTKPDRQAATLSALALLEAEFNDTRDQTANALISESSHTDALMMLSASVSMATILTRQLANVLGDQPENILGVLRESIEISYREDDTDE